MNGLFDVTMMMVFFMESLEIVFSFVLYLQIMMIVVVMVYIVMLMVVLMVVVLIVDIMVLVVIMIMIVMQFAWTSMHRHTFLVIVGVIYMFVMFMHIFSAFTMKD